MSNTMNEKEKVENLKPLMQVYGKWFYIVCVKGYEFEGTVFNKGDISRHCWGRNIPDHWQKATEIDWNNYINKPQF